MSVAAAVALDERPLKKAKVDKIENAPMPTTDKDECEFRNYEDSSRQDIVTNHYKLMRTHQTLEFHDRMVAKYGKFDHAKMTIREAFEVSTLLSARGVASMAVGRRLTITPTARPQSLGAGYVRGLLRPGRRLSQLRALSAGGMVASRSVVSSDWAASAWGESSRIRETVD
jgi:hypothetical protein